MSFTPNTNLQATPDFSNFQFTTKTTNGLIGRVVRFSGQKGGRIYQVDFRNRDARIKDAPSWSQSDEFLDVVVTLVLIIEIYSDRYPMRVLRFSPDNQIKALLFGHICGRFKYLWETLFTMEWERQKGEWIGQDSSGRAFLMSRKPIPYFSVHTIESNWHGVSRVFNSYFKIQLDKSLRLGWAVPNQKGTDWTGMPV